MSDSKYMIAGLGNPGSKYEMTRHNAGFLALDYFADNKDSGIDSEKMHGRYGSVRFSGHQVYLVKPQTYMNLSGQCIAQFSRYFDIDPERIMVVHDDLDLVPGRLKISRGGGAGGHKGIRSTIQHLGTDRFARLKIGIGRPENPESNQVIPVDRFVLSRFTENEFKLFEQNLERIVLAIELFVDSGIQKAMNTINVRATDTLD